DVANAVLDGTDAVMLSGETAGGKFPVEAVNIQRRICESAEKSIDYDSLFLRIRSRVLNHSPSGLSTPEAVCSAAVDLAAETNCGLIIAITETGATARLLAKYRPSQPILALSASLSTMRSLSVVRGVRALQVPSFQGSDRSWCHNKAKEVLPDADGNSLFPWPLHPIRVDHLFALDEFDGTQWARVDCSEIQVIAVLRQPYGQELADHWGQSCVITVKGI
ncbi:hypothetical protein FOZ62_005064, partial [Perkinsus olseni]